jgi:hypothetical protein
MNKNFLQFMIRRFCTLGVLCLFSTSLFSAENFSRKINTEELTLQAIQKKFDNYQYQYATGDYERLAFIENLPNWFSDLKRIRKSELTPALNERAERLQIDLINFAKDALKLSEPDIAKLLRPLSEMELKQIEDADTKLVFIEMRLNEHKKLKSLQIREQLEIIFNLPYWFTVLTETINANRTPSQVVSAKTIHETLLKFAKEKLLLSDADISKLESFHLLKEVHLRPTTGYFHHGKGEAPETTSSVWIKFPNGKGTQHAYLYDRNQTLILPRKYLGEITLYSGMTHRPIAVIPPDDLDKYRGMKIYEILAASRGIALEQAAGEEGVWVETDDAELKLFYPADVPITDLYGQGDIYLLRKIVGKEFSETEIQDGMNFLPLATIPADEITSRSRNVWTPQELLKYASIVLPEFSHRARCKEALRAMEAYKKSQNL